MAMQTNRRLIMVKQETTYGSDPTPTGTDNALLVRNLDVTPLEADVVSRDLVRPYYGAYDQVIARVRSGISFEVELVGAGNGTTTSTAPKYDTLLNCCGMSSAVTGTGNTGYRTYTPVSSELNSCTIYFNNDGLLHKLTGCRGTFTLSMTIGEVPVLKFTMTGIYNAPSDTALPGTITYSNQATPLAVNNTNTTVAAIGGYTPDISEFSIDYGNQVEYRELVGNRKEVLITNREVKGALKLEVVSLATRNWFSEFTSRNNTALTLSHGSTAGNRVVVSVPSMDLSTISYEDMNSIQMLNLPFVAVPTGSGNNEISIKTW